MIRHSPKTMTIRRYSKFEKSKDLRVLFRVYVPIWYAVKFSGQFVKEFNGLFKKDSENANEDLLIQLQYQNKIMLMQTLMLGVQMHLGEKIELEMLRPGYNAHLQVDPVLVHYLQEIEQCTGIKVETIEDIIVFRNELERKIDKYNELFPVKEAPKEGVSIYRLAHGVFEIMNMPFNDTVTLERLAFLRDEAGKIAKEREIMINKMKQQ